jgi:predicted membrane protein
MMDEPGTKKTDHLTFKDVYTLYESGKGRRYGLLFSVNGGAFAILSFLIKDACNDTLMHCSMVAVAVAIGMVLFTWIMWRDINEFGTKMGELAQAHGEKLYEKTGKFVLRALALLLTFAWVGVFIAAIFVLKISN